MGVFASMVLLSIKKLLTSSILAVGNIFRVRVQFEIG